MTEPQHMRALATANTIRYGRARLRDRVRHLEHEAGCRELARILGEGHHDELTRLDLVGFLKWAKRMQATKIRLLLDEVGCSPFKTIGDLSPRQRDLLAEALPLDVPALRKRAEVRNLRRWADQRNRAAA